MLNSLNKKTLAVRSDYKLQEQLDQEHAEEMAFQDLLEQERANARKKLYFRRKKPNMNGPCEGAIIAELGDGFQVFTTSTVAMLYKDGNKVMEAPTLEALIESIHRTK